MNYNGHDPNKRAFRVFFKRTLKMSFLKTFITYHLRPGLFIGSLVLSFIMLIAAQWQWTRYHEKLALVETFKSHKTDDSIDFETVKSSLKGDSESLAKLLNKKVSLQGEFDFSNQRLVINRRTQYGAGSWLLTPLKIKDSDKSIIISRGFIPYEEKEPSSWEKYNLDNKTLEFTGIFTQSTGKRSALSPKATTQNAKHFLYPDIKLIAESLPYPIVTDFYIQGILEPVINKFPLTDIKIDVPPSTHFWYTFEWIGLAILTQIICFLVQLFRPHTRK